MEYIPDPPTYWTKCACCDEGLGPFAKPPPRGLTCETCEECSAQERLESEESE